MSRLDEYREKLDCADEVERTYAAEDIGCLNSPDGVPVLLERLGKEPSRTVRDAIFQALIRIDGDAPIHAAIRLLESDDPQIRNQAVDVLRHKGDRSMPFLETAMRDGDKDLRKLVLDVLSCVRTGAADGIYEAALADPDANVVITAVENLGKMRAAGFRSRIEALLQTGSHPMLIAACVEALVGMGDASSLVAIRRRFPDLAILPDFFLASVLRAIAALGSSREFSEVARLLSVRGPHLRPAIFSALIAIRPGCLSPAPVEDLLPTLRAVVEGDDPPLCRYQAVRVLGLWATRDDIYALLASCLCDAERMVRLGAAEALRTAERPGWETLLTTRALDESDEEVLQALSC